MLFFAILITVIIVYVIQSKIYERHAFDSLSYDVKLSAEEVFEGEDIFMYEATAKICLCPPYESIPSCPRECIFDLPTRAAKMARTPFRA